MARSPRRDHHIVEHRFDADAIQMTGPDANMAAGVIARRKERQAADMVEMRVAIEEIHFGRLPRAHQLVAQQAQPSAAVEDDQPVPAPDLDTGSVAAVAHGIRSRAGDAAANPPKSHRVIRLHQSPDPKPYVPLDLLYR